MSYSMYRYQLLVDSTFPDENYFSLIKSKFELGSPYQHKDKYYFFKEIELNEHYFSAHLLFGDNNKYSPDVVYLEDNTLGPNPKKRNQIEPFNEIFIVYIFLENDLLLSTYNNSGLIKEILKFQKNDIVIKNKFVDVDTFIENITRLTEVKLFLDDNLFSDSEPLTRELNNYFGFDANNQYEISAKVNAPISNKIKNKIRSLNQKNQPVKSIP